MGRNEFKEVDIKNCTCYYFDDKIKIEDFDFDNIFIDEKSYKNILVYGYHAKLCSVQNYHVLDLIKQMDLLEFMMG